MGLFMNFAQPIEPGDGDGLSFEALWQFNERRPTPQATLEALMFSLRLGIIDGLARPGAKERLSRLSEEQLRAVCDRLRNFKPQIAKAWTAEKIGALVIIWSHLK